MHRHFGARIAVEFDSVADVRLDAAETAIKGPCVVVFDKDPKTSASVAGCHQALRRAMHEGAANPFSMCGLNDVDHVDFAWQAKSGISRGPAAAETDEFGTVEHEVKELICRLIAQDVVPARGARLDAHGIEDGLGHDAGIGLAPDLHMDAANVFCVSGHGGANDGHGERLPARSPGSKGPLTKPGNASAHSQGRPGRQMIAHIHLLEGQIRA